MEDFVLKINLGKKKKGETQRFAFVQLIFCVLIKYSIKLITNVSRSGK